MRGKRRLDFSSFEERKKEIIRLIEKYPNVCVTIRYNDSDRDSPHLRTIKLSEASDIPVSNEYIVEVLDCDNGLSATFVDMMALIWESS